MADCPYCHSSHKFKYQPQEAILDEDDNAIWISPNSNELVIASVHEYEIPINYCPMCGRKLNE